MARFVTYEDMVEYFNKKTLQEEHEPSKAKQLQGIKLFKKYARKGLIHMQWKNILKYHKDKLTKTRVTPVRTLRGMQPDNVKIQECEDNEALAQRMRRWAKRTGAKSGSK